MKNISLNNGWIYIASGVAECVNVPFSHLPVGSSVCEKTFLYSESEERVFLKFEGITYWARVTLNGTVLGEMLPYCEYSFEVTSLLKTENCLSVELEDIDRSFGPTEGWENFGGIIRDVSLVLKAHNYIKDVFFKSSLTDDLSSADINVEVECDSECEALEISLFDGEEKVLCYTQGSGDSPAKKLSDLKLWSPDSPHLYRLEVALLEGGKAIDNYSCSVGFRDISIDGHRFFLNGKPLFLGGVCKHEMIGESGHCPTEEQIEADLAKIKNMGCNFVRLVHYPHSKKTLEIADRIGLLVSEEPGLWWSDTSDEEVANGSLEVLKRTILRDRNHPSVAFWLCFNECKFTEKFLHDSAEVCRKYDPTRLVSGANCMSDEETLIHYNKCGFDFYTMHPYAPTFDRARRSAEILCDKPLVFTEWGGYFLYDNPHLLADFMIEMNELYLKGSLAGAFFWFFAELNDFNRGEPACTDGVLHEGLVDSERRPTLIYDSFCKYIKLFGKAHEQKPFWLEEGEGYEDMSKRSVLSADSDSDSFEKYFEKIKSAEAAKDCMRPRALKKGPILENNICGITAPTLVSADYPLTFSNIGKASSITLIGLTTLEGGYPLGKYGKDMGEMTVEYIDGEKERLILKNGVHITTAFTLNGSSRINVRAEQSLRFAKFGYDRNFECYTLNRLDIPVKKKDILSVKISADKDAPILIYGVFSE